MLKFEVPGKKSPAGAGLKSCLAVIRSKNSVLKCPQIRGRTAVGQTYIAAFVDEI